MSRTGARTDGEGGKWVIRDAAWSLAGSSFDCKSLLEVVMDL